MATMTSDEAALNDQGKQILKAYRQKKKKVVQAKKASAKGFQKLQKVKLEDSEQRALMDSVMEEVLTDPSILSNVDDTNNRMFDDMETKFRLVYGDDVEVLPGQTIHPAEYILIFRRKLEIAFDKLAETDSVFANRVKQVKATAFGKANALMKEEIDSAPNREVFELAQDEQAEKYRRIFWEELVPKEFQSLYDPFAKTVLAEIRGMYKTGIYVFPEWKTNKVSGVDPNWDRTTDVSFLGGGIQDMRPYVAVANAMAATGYRLVLDPRGDLVPRDNNPWGDEATLNSAKAIELGRKDAQKLSSLMWWIPLIAILYVNIVLVEYPAEGKLGWLGPIGAILDWFFVQLSGLFEMPLFNYLRLYVPDPNGPGVVAAAEKGKGWDAIATYLISIAGLWAPIWLVDNFVIDYLEDSIKKSILQGLMTPTINARKTSETYFRFCNTVYLLEGGCNLSQSYENKFISRQATFIRYKGGYVNAAFFLASITMPIWFVMMYFSSQVVYWEFRYVPTALMGIWVLEFFILCLVLRKVERGEMNASQMLVGLPIGIGSVLRDLRGLLGLYRGFSGVNTLAYEGYVKKSKEVFDKLRDISTWENGPKKHRAVQEQLARFEGVRKLEGSYRSVGGVQSGGRVAGEAAGLMDALTSYVMDPSGQGGFPPEALAKGIYWKAHYLPGFPLFVVKACAVLITVMGLLTLTGK